MDMTDKNTGKGIQKRQLKKKELVIILLFSFILAGFAFLSLKVWSDKHNEIRVVINEATDEASEVDIAVNIVKEWDDTDVRGNPIKGAQYDIIVKNNMNSTLVDWQMQITIPEEFKMDSSWNGKYILEDNQIAFTPSANLDINAVKPGATESFGMVLQSRNLLEIRDFVLVGHREARITDYAEFYFLLVLSVIVIVGIIGYVILDIRTRNLEQQRIKDEKTIMETMQVIADFVDAKDEYTKGHSTRVASYSKKIALKMKMSEEEVRNLGYIALMHDCGKMGIPDNVLNKPGRLTDEEMSVMRTHTVLGGKVLNSITALEGMREGALYHHERYDGKGYPEGLSGENIPLCARIICVADSYDAMNSDRCYRKHLEKEDIIKELKDNYGKQFDPEIARVMVKMLKNNELN